MKLKVFLKKIACKFVCCNSKCLNKEVAEELTREAEHLSVKDFKRIVRIESF